MRSERLRGLYQAGRRGGVVALGAVSVLGIITAPASADSWTGHLTGAGPGYESHRWGDDGGRTNIKFTGCKDDWNNERVAVQLFKDTFGPDPYYSSQNFSECFKGSTSTSSGWWEDHGSGSYYFDVNGALVGVHVSVASITVNY
ncbi:hypothetical protein ACN6LM_003378 [Streptomyces sp. SAS_281]|uniref:hypothetical protein n=1 Tax=Streptomyces sp. SAS_281 TaxID=3412744 RepID=UPI00403C83A5